ncbi:MAG: hypothetical protein AB1714_29650 [Acidobacteriota bacterium]
MRHGSAACLLLLLLAPAGLWGDVYVKGILRVEGGYRLGHHVPEQEVTCEWWIGRRQATCTRTGWRIDFMTNDWRFTVDRERNRMLGVNLTEKFFFETPLTASPVGIMEPPAAERLKMYKVDGTVEQAGAKEKVAGRTCEVYRVAEWIVRNGDRYYDRDRVVKVTREVPFDPQLAAAWEQWIRPLFNPASEYLEALNRMPGFLMAEDTVLYHNGNQLTWSFSVVEISEKKPPDGIYDVPGGFEKKNLGPAELADIRDAVYPQPLY